MFEPVPAATRPAGQLSRDRLMHLVSTLPAEERVALYRDLAASLRSDKLL